MVEKLSMISQSKSNTTTTLTPRISTVTNSIASSSSSSSNTIKNTSNSAPNKPMNDFEKLNYDLTNNQNLIKEYVIGKRIGFYTIGDNLGNGNFSQVKLGKHLLTKDYVAIKILDKTKLDEKTQRLLFREITCMEKLHHPNIIRLYEVINTNTRIYFCMEYAPEGELYAKINREGKLSEKYCKYLFSQIVAAVNHMHSHNIVHRDIKAENVLFADMKTIKVGDFGFSTYATKDQQLNTFCGSPPYAAPELFRDDSYIGIYVDVWALGVLLYFMLTSLMPFKADTVGRLKRCILNGEYVIPSYVSDSCQLLIRGILKPVPADRFTIKEIMESAWLDNQKFPSQLEPYQLTPTLDKNELKLEEKLARQYLTKLGISEDILIKRRKDDKIDLNTFENSLILKPSANTTSDTTKDQNQSFDDSNSITTVSTITNEKLFSQNYLDSQEFTNSIDGTYRIIYHRIQKQLRIKSNLAQIPPRSLLESLVNDPITTIPLTNTVKPPTIKIPNELSRRFTIHTNEPLKRDSAKNEFAFLKPNLPTAPQTSTKLPYLNHYTGTNKLLNKEHTNLKLKSSYGGGSGVVSSSGNSASNRSRPSMTQPIQKQTSKTCNIL